MSSALDPRTLECGLLIKLQLIARQLDPTSKVPLKMYGQELQAESYAVARMNTSSTTWMSTCSAATP